LRGEQDAKTQVVYDGRPGRAVGSGFGPGFYG
jgi:hypothetical protein